MPYLTGLAIARPSGSLSKQNEAKKKIHIFFDKAQADKTAWLNKEGAKDRALLTQIIMSLSLLENTELAKNLASLAASTLASFGLVAESEHFASLEMAIAVNMTKKQKKAKAFERAPRLEAPENSHPTVNNFAGFNNVCLEEAIAFIAHRHHISASFDTANYKKRNDIQLSITDILLEIDIDYLIASEPRYLGMHTKGKSEEDIHAFLEPLEKASCYIIRTGQQTGAGHFSVLFYEDGIWQLYNSQSHAIKVTTECGKLTQAAKDKFVLPNGDWGDKSHQLAIAYTRIKPEQISAIIACINKLRSA